ncbi:DUF3971 domain-containing protein [Maritimibacter dapengensis]|uniref:DUF3971 domain-containing protein n=1 Tax=Maritimibacter dapengensis TaxID=2836868 RepID=A0ABS6T4G0_9RHOB|nr:DUF3971 domain-containing protein [Maritimibacter dapengensis]MBV7379436.1 DUF3971 domain-containing protein [Maritimibacter dapengensis]
MSDTDNPAGMREGEDPPRASWWKRYRFHFHLGFWSILAVGLIFLFLVFASMSLTGRSIALPNWVAERVEARLNGALPEGEITLRQFEFGVTRKGRPRFRLVDVSLRDASGLDIAQLNAIEGGLRLAPMFRGELIPRTAILSGAQVTFRRLGDGSFALQFGQGDTATGNLADMIDAIDATFAQGMLNEAGRVAAEGLTITLEDARSGRLWQVTDGRLEITQTDKIVETQVKFDVFNQTEELAVVDLSLRSDKATSAASLSATFQNAGAADIGAQSPALSFLQLIDAPVSGALRTTMGADGALTDLAGVLSMDQGAVKAAPGAKPVTFGGAKGYIDYDPDKSELNLSSLTFSSELGEIEMDAKLHFVDYAAGWPQSVLGQIRLSRALLTDTRLFDAPLEIDRGYADMRVRLSPFELDIGQAVLFHDDHRYEVTGEISATREEWDLALDMHVPELTVDELKSVWPKPVSANARKWVFDRTESGTIRDVHMALRGPNLQDASLVIGGRLSDGTVKVLPTLPSARKASGYLSLSDREMVVHVEAGEFPSPAGDAVDASGTTFTIPDVTQKPGRGVVDLRLAGPVHAGLGLLNLPPIRALDGTGFGTDVVAGKFDAEGTARFPLLKDLPANEIEYDVAGHLVDVETEKIVPGSVLTADNLSFKADPQSVTIWGPGKIGDSAVTATWTQPFGKDAAQAGSSVTGRVALSSSLSDEFGLGIGEMISGSTPTSFVLDLVPGEPPKLTALSKLEGLGITIPQVGYRKSPDSSGNLTASAILGPQPEVTDFRLVAPGLTALGDITTREGGGLDRVRMSRVKLGNWLNAPVTLTGRGGQPMSIDVLGGLADLRQAGFDTGGGGSLGAGGPSQPLSIRLKRLDIAEGIVLHNFRGAFDLAGGLSGDFTAQVEGGIPIEGTVIQTARGAAYRITSKDGGRTLKGLGVFAKAQAGQLEVVLVPTGEPGTFEGDMLLTNTRLVDAPAMAEMLAAISVVGLIDQLDGKGIFFSEVKGRFRLSPKRVTLYESSAISSSIGLSLDGYYNLDSNTLDMQGVLSPFYLINSIGRVLSARDGEGLLGFSFTLTGPDSNPNVGLNPLSALTPGFLREIFRRQAPTKPGE